MISEQVTTRNGQRGFVGPDGKWYPIAGQTPTTPNFGERLPGESTKDFHDRLRGNLPPAQPEAPKPEAPKPEAPKPEAPKPAAKTYDVDGEKLTKAQINTRYNELRKQAGGLQPGSSAEKFGMSANQAIFGKNFAKPKTPNPLMKRYKQPSVEKTNEAYDVVLDYLLSEGHADTVEEAHYVMMQLDSEFIQDIVEAGEGRVNLTYPAGHPKYGQPMKVDGKPMSVSKKTADWNSKMNRYKEQDPEGYKKAKGMMGPYGWTEPPKGYNPPNWM